MIEIDGTMGEGGGQILRSSLALSMATCTPVRITNVRGKRPKPGLMRQHLTALQAAQEICGGHATGAHIGSTEIAFHPDDVHPGEYHFSVGTAGSANLVLQTILPVLLHAKGPSRLIINGGTHNLAAPPFEFINEAYCPALRLIGHNVTARIHQYGFYPAGGGKIEVEVTPAKALRALTLNTRGPERTRSLEAIISNLTGSIAERELTTAGAALNVPENERHIRTRESNGPGNVLIARIEYDKLTALFVQFGQFGLSAEQVAKRLAKSANKFIKSGAAVTHHLADQLLLPMALAKGGSFTTLRPSLHFKTNAEVITRFRDTRIDITPDNEGNSYLCRVDGQDSAS